MGFETLRPQPGKTPEQIIAEVEEDLDRGLYDEGERNEAVAKLHVARIAARPDSPERLAIDRLLGDIEARYSKG